MKDRIKHLMESQHMTQNTFAQFIGLSPATLSSIFNGRTNPTLATVEAIRSKLPLLNTDWLVFGTGAMFKKSSSDDNAASDIETQPFQPPLLFDAEDTTPPSQGTDENPRQYTPKSVPNTKNIVMKNIDKTNKSIVEIRVFYNDQTYESFVPKK